MIKILKNIKSFFCFYLIIPIFVLAILISGINSVNIVSAQEQPDTAHTLVTDDKNVPSAFLLHEVANPDDSYPIMAKDLSKEYNILNSTSITVDEEKLSSVPLPHGSNEPLVLVVHTHATECFADAEKSFATSAADGYYGYYRENDATRTDNTELNMIAVGAVFCEALAQNGISSIQCRTLHDRDDYNSAYANSRASIKKYLEKYPSIKYVIDLHRDSLGENGEEKIKPMSQIDGTAQVMLVAGCQGNGVVYENWEENLALALQYKKAMDEKYPTLSRPIYLRYSRYNLDLLTGSMLLEVGSCANTLNEAKNAARLAGECFALLIK